MNAWERRKSATEIKNLNLNAKNEEKQKRKRKKKEKQKKEKQKKEKQKRKRIMTEDGKVHTEKKIEEETAQTHWHHTQNERIKYIKKNL